MYWPDGVIVPGPLLVSPPESDQVTAAAPPPAIVALNCSTGVPSVLVALQPVQLVSIEAVPGAIENVGLVGSALTPPPAQPANTTSTGPRSAARMRVCCAAELRLKCADGAVACSLLKKAGGPRVEKFIPAISILFRPGLLLAHISREVKFRLPLG